MKPSISLRNTLNAFHDHFSPQSVASDMRFKGVFVEKEVKHDSKRQRVINSRYREDYIEPVIYRAIME